MTAIPSFRLVPVIINLSKKVYEAIVSAENEAPSTLQFKNVFTANGVLVSFLQE
jgi:hypothetical protein